MRFLVLVAVCLVFSFCSSIISARRDKPTRCYAPKYADGPQCKAYFERYTYNSRKGKCEKFVYGGCNPSPNNFETLKKCKRICERS